jgi:anti-sigma regulatory factor (Ser/Thr protein kinase)
MRGRYAGSRVWVVWRWSGCTPGGVALARGALRCALDQLGYCGEVISDVVLAGSELVANATEHAVGPYELRLCRAREEIICEVVDHDPRIPDIPDFPKGGLFVPDPADCGGGLDALCGLLKERGRGLQIVDHLTQSRWGFTLPGNGKKIAWAAFVASSSQPSIQRGGSDDEHDDFPGK